MTELDTETLKQRLLTTDSHFRDLVRTHTRYEERLAELSALMHPNDHEQLEEATLKKKKLAIKDQMQEIMARNQDYASARAGH